MNEQTVRALGFILACNARVEGMRAANQQRAAVGESMAYDSHDFDAEAAQMERIAHELQS
jgi:hypothetical protein